MHVLRYEIAGQSVTAERDPRRGPPCHAVRIDEGPVVGWVVQNPQGRYVGHLGSDRPDGATDAASLVIANDVRVAVERVVHVVS